MSKHLTKQLVKKIHAHMEGTQALVSEYGSGFAYLCYIFAGDVFYTKNTIPDLTAWEKEKLSELLELFRPTFNEFVENREHPVERAIQLRTSDLDSPITFSAPWFGYYGEAEKNSVREYAFWLIVAMLEAEAK